MKPEDFTKKLAMMDVPVVPSKSHKQWLRHALQAKFAETPKQRRISWRSSFTLSSMTFLQRFVPAVLAVFIFTFSIYTQIFTTSSTANADTILRQAIDNIIEVSKERGELLSPETQLTLDLLGKALESKEVEYVGEQKDPNGQKTTVLGLKDQATGRVLSISINPYQSFDPSYAANYSLYLIRAWFLYPDGKTQHITSDIKNGNLENSLELQQKLKDPALQNPLMLQLIKRQNSVTFTQMERYQQDYGKWCDEVMGGTPPDEQAAFTKEDNITEQQALDLLKPLFEQAEVLVNSPFCSHDSNGKIYQFIFESDFPSSPAVAGIKQQKDSAQILVQDTLKKLSSDTSPEAEIKRKFLIRASQSPTLISLPDNDASAPLQTFDEKGNSSWVYNKQVKNITFEGKNCDPILGPEPCITFSLSIDLSEPFTAKNIMLYYFTLDKDPDHDPDAVKIEGTIDHNMVTNTNEVMNHLRDNDPTNDAITNLIDYANLRLLEHRWNQNDPANKAFKQLLGPILKQSEYYIIAIEPHGLPDADYHDAAERYSSFTLWAVPVYDLFK